MQYIPLKRQSLSIETRLKDEQIRLSFNQIAFVVFLPPISGMILGFLLWGVVSHTIITIWLISVLCCCTLFGSWVLWKRKNITFINDTEYWSKVLISFALVGGGAWGVGGYFLFVPDKVSYLGLLLLWMYIPAATAAMITLAYKPLFYSNTTVMLLPLFVRFVEEGGVFNITMAVTTLIYVGCLCYFHSHINSMLIDSIRLRFEKSDLLDEVTIGKEIAENANIAKSRFLAAASHDLRQPLHAQTLFIAELKHRVKEPESAEIIEHLESSVEAMGELFNSLLDISKLDAATIKLNVVPFQLQKLFEKLENNFKLEAGKKGLSLHFIATSEMIASDYSLLSRMLQNLIANAIRYTDSGFVIICCRKHGSELRIEIRDSGKGIEINDQEKIFDEFVQLHNPERNQKNGLGLGLAIVVRLSRLLEHRVIIRSQPNKGSVFSVIVPKLGYQKKDSIQVQINESYDKQLDHVEILVIDNEESIRIGMKMLLNDWGCVVKTAADYSQAISIIETEKFCPRIVVSDYRLSTKETGIDVLDRLCEMMDNKVHGILITGDTSIDILQEASLSGYDLLHKPVSLHKLKMSIRSLL
jgi:signal transduction histidine kinase/CheY-like chemotaxis protein